MQNNEYGSALSTGRSELRVPIGGPFESAELYMPVAGTTMPDIHDVTQPARGRAWREAIDDAWSSMIGEVSERVSAIEPVVMEKATAIRDSLLHGSEKLHETFVSQAAVVRAETRKRMTRAESEVRAHPTKWAGVAAGAGLAVGLLGRFLRRRRAAARVPQLIIIEAC